MCTRQWSFPLSTLLRCKFQSPFVSHLSSVQPSTSPPLLCFIKCFLISASHQGLLFQPKNHRTIPLTLTLFPHSHFGAEHPLFSVYLWPWRDLLVSYMIDIMVTIWKMWSPTSCSYSDLCALSTPAPTTFSKPRVSSHLLLLSTCFKPCVSYLSPSLIQVVLHHFEYSKHSNYGSITLFSLFVLPLVLLS